MWGKRHKPQSQKGEVKVDKTLGGEVNLGSAVSGWHKTSLSGRKKKLIVLSVDHFISHPDINSSIHLYPLKSSYLYWPCLYCLSCLSGWFPLLILIKWRKVSEPAFPSATEPICARRSLAHWSMPEPRDSLPNYRSLHHSHDLKPLWNQRWT